MFISPTPTLKALPEKKLGKLPAKHDPRTLLLSNYLRLTEPPPPSIDWTGKVRGLGMMGNDRVGDCTCACAGHLIQEWTANAGAMVVPPDSDIIGAYSAISGYDPATGQNDNGANEIDVLNYWRQTGIAGHKIEAYVATEPGNHDHIKASVALFEGCYIGVQLPITAQGQDVWSVPPGGPVGYAAPGTWGGHAVPVVAYDPIGLIVITWGALKRMTWQFFDSYTDESYAPLSPDVLSSSGTAPTGLNLDQLRADLIEVTG